MMNVFTSTRSLMRAAKLIASLSSVALCAAVHAGGDYDVPWYTIDGGGGTSSGGAFIVSGTIGQLDAGVLAGGVFELHGGFWHGGDATTPPSCFGDLNNDGSVGVPDLLALLAAWGPNPGHAADLTGDGSVGVPDLLALLGAWGPCP